MKKTIIISLFILNFSTNLFSQSIGKLDSYNFDQYYDFEHGEGSRLGIELSRDIEDNGTCLEDLRIKCAYEKAREFNVGIGILDAPGIYMSKYYSVYCSTDFYFRKNNGSEKVIENYLTVGTWSDSDIFSFFSSKERPGTKRQALRQSANFYHRKFFNSRCENSSLPSFDDFFEILSDEVLNLN